MATKLARAIANEQGVVSATVYVGQLPPGTKPAIPLPDGTLLGSEVERAPREVRLRTAFGSMMGSPVTYFYEFSAGAAGTAAYEKRLSSAGWSESTFVHRMQNAVSPEGGFAVTKLHLPVRRMFCNKGGDAYIMVQPISGMPGVLGISSSKGKPAKIVCAMSTMMDSAAPQTSPPPLPKISAPQDAILGDDSEHIGELLETNSSALLSTSAPLATVGADIARQITASGWAADPPAQSLTAYAQTFHRLSSGHTFQLVLTIIGTGKAGKYAAQMHIDDVNGSASMFPF